jgi:hypothetical protein
MSLTCESLHDLAARNVLNTENGDYWGREQARRLIPHPSEPYTFLDCEKTSQNSPARHPLIL